MATNLARFEPEFKRRYRRLSKALDNDIPRVIANEHVRGFKQSFRMQRFNDSGTTSWRRPKRKDTSSAFPPPTTSGLTRSTLVGKGGGGMSGLSDSFRVKFSGNDIIIENTKDYAGLHNEGGKNKVSVTPKMRKFAWAMYYKSKKRGAANAESWKGLALTKKKTITVTIPERKFMGHSRAIDKQSENEIDQELNEIFLK